MTQDIDIVIELSMHQVPSLCDAFPESDFYVSKAAAQEAVQLGRQFNVIHPASGNKIDFMIAGQTEWASAQIARRRMTSIFPDVDGYVAAPEDVMLGKMIYYREGGSDKHLRDITGILRVCGDKVDLQSVEQFANKLGVTEIWQAILKRLEDE